MLFDPSKVISLLKDEFGTFGGPLLPSRLEKKLSDRFAMILRDTLNGELFVDESEDLQRDEPTAEDDDPYWIEDVEIAMPEYVNADTIFFSDRPVSLEMVRKAIIYYRQPVQGFRSVSSMQHKFSFIKTDAHITKLRHLEKQATLKGDLTSRLQALSSTLFDVVSAKLDSGISMRDADLQAMARKINKEYSYVEGFKASVTWIRFKKRVGLVSRKVTTFTTKANYINKDKIADSAKRFVSEIKTLMQVMPLDGVCNADQSGFLKELTCARSLAPRGVRRVERIIQSASAMTHSYSIMPMLYADGRLGDQLLVVLQEPRGVFPQRGHFTAENLYVQAGTTHIMTKNLMLDWFNNVVFANNTPAHTLLVVDSWSSFKDHISIAETVPHGKQLTLRNLPPGTTSIAQPLDVYFFRTFKAFVKKMHDHVHAFELDFPLHKRDNILKILSQAYWIFTSPQFQRFLSYPWFAAGYLDVHPGPFETPLQACFPQHNTGECGTPGCDDVFLLVCAHCCQEMCFKHFVIDFHRC